MKITENIHVIPGVTAHPYLLVDPDGLTLIDTGIPGSAHKILRYVKQIGYSPRAINRILLTHADYDHAGSLARLKRASGARVYSSLHEARAMATGEFPRSLKSSSKLLQPILMIAERLGRISPAHVDEHLVDGQMLPVLNGLQVVDTQGHTPGHLSFYAIKQGILFSGDSILSLKEGLAGSRGPVTWDQEKANASVLKQLGFTVRMICSGHGAVVRVGLGMLVKLAETVAAAPVVQQL